MSVSFDGGQAGPETEDSSRYQWLNHYALFSGGYREDAMESMEKLVAKYGKENEEEEDDSSDVS